MTDSEKMDQLILKIDGISEQGRRIEEMLGLLVQDKTLAGFLDQRMSRPKGIAWTTLLRISKKFAEAEGWDTVFTVGTLRAHALDRKKRGWDLKMDDKRVSLTRP